MLAAALLAALTLNHQITAPGLLVLTFCIGIGAALGDPAWNAIVPDLVPREDLVPAVALGGIGLNLARTVGPAFAGILVLIGGPGPAFALYMVSLGAVLWALWVWRGGSRSQAVTLPREHVVAAMRRGTRFVRSAPAIRAAMMRGIAFALPASAPFALLPLVLRMRLGLGPGMFGLTLGLTGAGGVISGLLIPRLAQRMSHGTMVFLATLASCSGIALLALARDWPYAALGVTLFGTGWGVASAMIQATAQLACPPWVRARALAIYRLSVNGALTVGLLGWSWLAGRIGLSETLLAAALLGVAVAMPVRLFGLDAPVARAEVELPAEPPDMPAPDLLPALARRRQRVMEIKRYTVTPSQRPDFLAAMAEVRLVRRRAGAVLWRLYEDVAHPNTFLEEWMVDSWTEHLREEVRSFGEDSAILGRAAAFHAEGLPPAERFITINPTHDLVTILAQQAVTTWSVAEVTPSQAPPRSGHVNDAVS